MNQVHDQCLLCLHRHDQDFEAQLGEMAERLALVVGEVERLRAEREELTYQLRRMHDVLEAKTAGGPGGGGLLGRGLCRRLAIHFIHFTMHVRMVSGV